MAKNSKFKIENSNLKPAALLWDESFLWGIMAYRALNAAGLPFELIRSEDIQRGCLSEFAMLFVPGGWASNKLKALGDQGANAIREFVQAGRNYVGFCGGAGLATRDGINLLQVRRKPTKDRIPSFSGRIKLRVDHHSVWKGIKEPVFQAWWPSQFLVEDRTVRVLGTFEQAHSDSFSSDLNVGDIETSGSWEKPEAVYGINLDPRRLCGEPAVLEGECGKGKVILSLVHFDTPDDFSGSVVLKNIWGRVGGVSNKSQRLTARSIPKAPSQKAAEELRSTVDELITLGHRNFLWFRRNSLLLQWRRGVRGLEYCTLQVLMSEIARLSVGISSDQVVKIQEILLPFIDKAKRLLILERQALQNGHMTYEKCDDPEIQKLRTELFSTTKSHGGKFKELIDTIDNVLYPLLKKDA